MGEITWRCPCGAVLVPDIGPGTRYRCPAPDCNTVLTVTLSSGRAAATSAAPEEPAP